MAETVPVLLILDQVDALARYIDLRTERLNVLLNLVRRLGRTHNVHIVVSSRTFEFQHDSRLQSVYAESVTLELPPWNVVLQILASHGVHAAGWPQGRTGVDAVAAGPGDLPETPRAPRLRGIHELPDHARPLVERTPARTRKRCPLESACNRDRQLHAEEESLWLATARFDEKTSDVDALEAAGIFTRLGQKVGFTHQTLFDYALARNFAREPGRLRSYVLTRQESLFLRPKLWAALTYLRDAEPKAYQGELEAVWNAPKLRRHLRYLLIEFIGQQAEPTDREALLMEQALQLQEERWTAYRALTGSPGWFERFGSNFVADCMSESDGSADQMVGVLSGAWAFAGDDVVCLLLDRWAPEIHHDLRSWTVLERAPHWSEEALELARTIVSRTEMASFSIDHVTATIGAVQPEVALHLNRAYLDRQLTVAQAEAHELVKSRPQVQELRREDRVGRQEQSTQCPDQTDKERPWFGYASGLG